MCNIVARRQHPKKLRYTGTIVNLRRRKKIGCITIARRRRRTKTRARRRRRTFSKNKARRRCRNILKTTRARRRDNDEQISNSKSEAATCAPICPGALLGRFWPPPRKSRGAPAEKNSSPTFCSRMWAGNQIFPPVTSFLF